jgi:hypothetical protein
MKLLKTLNLFKNNQAHSQMERRLEKRHLSHFSATVSQKNSDTQECIATVLNFSKSGVAILSTKAIPINEVLTIQLAFNSERSVKALFKVTSCREVEAGFMIGCQLAEPNTHYESLIHKIIQPRHSVVSDCW